MPRWDDALLDRCRQRTDPLADEVVAAIFARLGIGAVRALPGMLSASSPAASLPEEAADYYARTATVAERDPVMTSRGEKVFIDYGPEILMILCCYSLPAAYAARKGVEVLHRTAYLEKRPNRRLFVTAQMIVDVMTPGGLLPGGPGLRSAQRVRLMHAAIRHLLQNDPHTPWDGNAFGLPINQEDMAGTLMTFSWLTLDGLSKLGIPLSDEQQMAYLDAWNTVGRLMGVEEALLPRTVAEAHALSDLIERRQVEPSRPGQEMTAALLGMMCENLPLAFRRLPAAMLRLFLPPAVADGLGVPTYLLDAVVDEAIAAGVRHFNADMHRDDVRRLAIHAFSARMVSWMLTVELDGRPPAFALPENLQEGWKLAPAGSEEGFFEKLAQWWRGRRGA